MKNRRSVAITAAIAMTAPLAIGATLARADELADLRANQELLQKRIDQLSQMIPSSGNAYTGGVPGAGVYPGPGSSPYAGRPGVGGSFPRSFLIPGTDTSIRVGGRIAEVLDYWMNGGPPNSSPQTTTVGDNGQALSVPLNIHVPGTTAGIPRARSTDVFSQTPKESKVNFETRTPTPWGEARTFMEFDWAGSNGFAPGGGNPTSVADNLHPRLKFAYGTLGGILAGQANSNFSDPDASPETIDFGGNVGDPGIVRIPQVRYTMPLTPWGVVGALSMSAETPETDAWLPTSGVLGSDAGALGGVGGPTLAYTNPLKAGAPDLTWAWYIPQAWGHMDYSFVFRPSMQLKDGVSVDRTFMGYGVHFGGDVKPAWFGWNKDFITWQFTYGDGIGRYLNAGSNFAIVTNFPNPGFAGGATAAALTPANSPFVRATTTIEWGGDVSYRHYWAPNLRSNISAGIIHHDVNNLGGPFGFVCTGATGVASPRTTGAGGCGINKEIVTAHANLIWNPVPFVDFGLEYVYGHRIVFSNLKGDENVLIARMGINF